MHLYYKVNEVFDVLTILLKKARKEGYSISVCFEKLEEAKAASKKLWAAYDVIVHGLVEDGYMQEQNIILDDALHKKDVAIVIGNAIFKEDIFKKVFFINSPVYGEGKFYENKNGIWNEISKEEYCK